MNLKNLFSHCFNTFSPLHKLQLCSYIGKFWCIYVISIKINKKVSQFIPTPSPPRLLYFTEFSDTLFIRTPSFVRDVRVCNTQGEFISCNVDKTFLTLLEFWVNTCILFCLQCCCLWTSSGIRRGWYF